MFCFGFRVYGLGFRVLTLGFAACMAMQRGKVEIRVQLKHLVKGYRIHGLGHLKLIWRVESFMLLLLGILL